MKLFLMFCLLFTSSLAFSVDSEAEYSYFCKLNAQINRTQDFSRESQASNFCDPFGERCTVSQRRDRTWRGTFNQLLEVRYTSRVSWADARSNAVIILDRFSSQNGYFNENFTHSYNYSKCY